MSKAKIGIIGLGKQGGGNFLPCLQQSPYFELTSLCDISQNNLALAKQAVNEKVALYNNPMEMLHKEKLDSVILALPHDQYLPVIKAAAQKKINILKEKPYAMNLTEAYEITDIIREAEINFMVSCQFRFEPMYVKIKQLLSSIGAIHLIRLWYNISSSKPNANWRAYKNTAGGGVLLDIGYHLVDLLLWYFNEGITIQFAQSSNKFPMRYELEDTASVNFNLRNNIRGDFTVSCIYPYKSVGILLAGEDGSIFCQNKKIELRDANCKIIEIMDYSPISQSCLSTNSTIEAFAIKNLQGKLYGIKEAEYHNENHMSLIEDAYQIINMVNKYETGYKWWKGYSRASL
jgi:predicted dehydrogenase